MQGVLYEKERVCHKRTPVVQVDGGLVADALGALHKVKRGQGLRGAHVGGRHVGDDLGLGIAAQGVLCERA